MKKYGRPYYVCEETGIAYPIFGGAILPVGLVIAAIGVSALGAGIGAYSNYMQGQAISRQSATNALIAQRNAALSANKAELTRQTTELEAKKFQKKIKALKGAQTVEYAKAGVQAEGTPIITAAETQRQADIDELAIRYAGSVELSNVLAEQAEQKQMAILLKMQGTQARQSGIFGAGSSLLSGLGQTGLGAAAYFKD